jgi:hypothetical protein
MFQIKIPISRMTGKVELTRNENAEENCTFIPEIHTMFLKENSE